MRDYFFALLAASVFGALCAAFAGSRFEKQMRFIAALCLLASALLPLKQIVPALRDFSGGTGEYAVSQPAAAGDYYAQAEEAAKERVSELLYGEFGIKPRSVSIDIDWESETPQVTRIRVALPPGVDADAAKSFLQSELGGETEIVGE